MLPEIILLAKAENPICRNANLFIPDAECLIVIQIYGRIETLRIQSYHLRQKLPGPVDGFRFEIVTKREVSQHLKKCAVAGCLSDIFNITGADALLTGRHTSARRDLLSGKIGL